MNTNAANALLKNLEEPIGQTYFMLVSVNPSRLLATIKSRCTRIPLPTPRWEEGLGWLNQQGIAQAQEKLTSAQGAPLRVIKMAKGGLLRAMCNSGRAFGAVFNGPAIALSNCQTHEPIRSCIGT